MEKNFVVYKITNSENDKVYIGCTSNFEKRKKEHLAAAKCDKPKYAIHRAMRYHRSENFIFTEVFHALTYGDMLWGEIILIEEYDTFKYGYNSTLGGEGKPHTTEAKLKMGVLRKGKKRPPFSEEWKSRMSASAKRKMFSEEHKDKLSASAKGKKKSDKTKAKISATRIKFPVSQYNKITGELITTFPSIMEAGSITGIHHTAIGKCCKGKLKSAGGYLWKYTTSPL